MSQLETQSRPVLVESGQPEQGYRAVSILAIVSLILGLLSMVTLVSPLLGFVAIAAIVVSCVALRRIAVNSDRLSGRTFAAVGVILPCLFLGWGLTKDFSRRDKVFGYARKFGDDWLQILKRRESYVAHQLKVVQKYRMDPQTNLEVAYQRDESATQEYKLFVGESPVKEILAAAPNVDFEFEEYFRHTQTGATDNVILQYRYITPSESKQFWLTVRRNYSSISDRADWNVVGVTVMRPYGG